MTKNNTPVTEESIQRTLNEFNGNLNYHYHDVGKNTLLLTDGCHYVKKELKAFWLFDLITTYQESFKYELDMVQQFWQFQKVPDEGIFLLTCNDRCGDEIISQKVSVQEFPLSELTIWVIGNTAMLPTEY